MPSTMICSPAFSPDSTTTFTPTSPLGYTENMYGGTFGGPIIKNKTLFYFGYEGWHFAQPTDSFVNVPTAQELGGEIRTPRLSWKYSWIESLCGEKTARRAQFVLPRLKWSVIRFGDKVLFRMANSSSSPLRTGA